MSMETCNSWKHLHKERFKTMNSNWQHQIGDKQPPWHGTIDDFTNYTRNDNFFWNKFLNMSMSSKVLQDPLVKLFLIDFGFEQLENRKQEYSFGNSQMSKFCMRFHQQLNHKWNHHSKEIDLLSSPIKSNSVVCRPLETKDLGKAYQLLSAILNALADDKGKHTLLLQQHPGKSWYGAGNYQVQKRCGVNSLSSQVNQKHTSRIAYYAILRLIIVLISNDKSFKGSNSSSAEYSFANLTICGEKITGKNSTADFYYDQIQYEISFLIATLFSLILLQVNLDLLRSKAEQFTNLVNCAAIAQLLLSLSTDSTIKKCDLYKHNSEGDDFNDKSVVSFKMRLQGGVGDIDLSGNNIPLQVMEGQLLDDRMWMGFRGVDQNEGADGPFMNQEGNGDDDLLNEVPDFYEENMEGEDFDDDDDVDQDIIEAAFARRINAAFEHESSLRRVPSISSLPPVDDFMGGEDEEYGEQSRAIAIPEDAWPNGNLNNPAEIDLILQLADTVPILHDPEPLLEAGLQDMPAWLDASIIDHGAFDDVFVMANNPNAA